ncbi:MAG: hypothetical protein M3443_06670, partial [Actinomycetota bacterium]|nr:hypothetical protein [Actinomycetota bacterium]
IRAEHATVLQAEVDRERPPPSSAPAAPPPSALPEVPAEAGAARKKLLDALSSAEKQAADLVPTIPRYRAGMVGSVAAACASLREVTA